MAWAPGLVPVVLGGLAAALLFILVRRVTNGWVATLTFVLWLPLRDNLRFKPSYFSENTTSVLWLLGWWALLEWWETGRERWLALVAACTAWIAITRPFTAVAFALPIAAVVLWRVARQRSWAQLARPALVAVAIVGVLPLWSTKTTHSWHELPDMLYAKLYFPFDALGFGLDTTPPARALPPDMHNLIKEFGPTHAAHTVAKLPETFYDRWSVMFDDAFGGLRLLRLFAVIGLLTLSGAGWFAVAGSLTLTLCYLLYAHPASWDLYYLEIFASAALPHGVWHLGLLAHARKAPLRLGNRYFERLTPPGGSRRHAPRGAAHGPRARRYRSRAWRSDRAARISAAFAPAGRGAARPTNDRLHSVRSAITIGTAVSSRITPT